MSYLLYKILAGAKMSNLGKAALVQVEKNIVLRKFMSFIFKMGFIQLNRSFEPHLPSSGKGIGRYSGEYIIDLDIIKLELINSKRNTCPYRANSRMKH